MPQDSDFAREASLIPIAELARERLNVPNDGLIPYGRNAAKITLPWIESLPARPPGRLILVTSITATRRGEGKTGQAIGLTDALNRLGKRTIVCLREPSLGPVFGVKGGATGGGRAQVVPRHDINLHFTGDFHAAASAHNLLAAMLDNHLYRGNALGVEPGTIAWTRVLDLNDRALRSVLIHAEPPGNPRARLTHFEIVPGSEVMAVLALAESWADLGERLRRIVVAWDRDGRPVRAGDLRAAGAMASLLRDALQPNLVQTLENNPALVHTGPFANIAHGCNSVVATRAALRLADYVVTEAGFGADLGAEKFVSIKCRQSGLRPAAVVIVATLATLKYHGGASADRPDEADGDAMERGMANLARHVHIVREVLGLPCVVSLNRFAADTEAELERARELIGALGVPVCMSDHWALGAEGTEELARVVLALAAAPPVTRFAYDISLSLFEKVRAVATRVYGAAAVEADPIVQAQIERLDAAGYGALPVCVAKTQFSFSTDPALRGAPTGHVVRIRDIRLAAGAGFVVAFAGDILTMPGLPARPRAEQIGLNRVGHITGLE